MEDLQEIHCKLKVIDDEVIRLLTDYIPDHNQIAVETYQFGLLVRELAIKDIDLKEKRSNRKQPVWEALLKSEAFVRLLILLVVIFFKWGSAPLVKLLSKVRG